MGTGPTTRRRQLGFRLRELRERSGLTAEEAGHRAGMSKATVSRYESSMGPVRWNQVYQLCVVYGVSVEERDALVELAKNSKNTDGWWVPLTGGDRSTFGMLIALENEATRIRQFSPVFVPGLLQTREYAFGIRQLPVAQLPANAEELLELRMERQKILSGPEPPSFHVVLDESVLRRTVGGARTMARQLGHLLDLAASPRITMQVLPFDSGAHTAAHSNFMILGGEDPALDVIYTESFSGGLYLEKPEERELCATAFDYLSAEALDPDTSATLIAEAGKKHMRALQGTERDRA
ncbi:helix-turn-helix domain-containing protein [Streptomyces aidingensis]|uniref:Helix-turn-helix domain-containing protein n=1 Tax=Streptomyces aidingensis TaxID=910347 RepID=A0A1I1V6W2_9ACTN|nr:helix-turn-helix transcriptional regulator [Streptomyces aidingensis]SFD77768.1 Helix-turn-helix domain-containing protein [Streptomyces aidingensis]